jgi:Tfp pilus assembly protein PilN
MFKKPKSPLTLSPCGLAIDQRNGLVIIAEYSSEGGFTIQSAVLGERRAVNLLSPDFRTTLSRGSAHTDAFNVAIPADADDETILRALSQNNDPNAQVAFSRTPDSRLLVTQVETAAVMDVIRRTNEWIGQQQPEHFQSPDQTLAVETRTRAISRLWRNFQDADTITGTTAFLVMSPDDYAVGLWSEQSGLRYETEELFERGASEEIKCQHARDSFIKFLAAASLARLQLSEVKNIVVSAPDTYLNMMLALLHESMTLSGINIEAISLGHTDNTSLDQPTAFAIGSLLDHASVPQCNLALSPITKLNQIEQAVLYQQTAQVSQQARTAFLAILIPIVAVAAFVIIAWGDNRVEAARLNSRITEETLVSQKLTKENADYESSKANFAAFHTLLDKIITLRQRQPATPQLLIDLNQRWPDDPSWFVSEINVKGGSVEIKGKTKNEQAITSFAKSLEFSNGLFSGILTRNNVEGNSALSTIQQQNQLPRSSVVEFIITASYAPLASPGTPVPASNLQPQPLRTASPLANNPQPGPKGTATPAGNPTTVTPGVAQPKSPEGLN